MVHCSVFAASNRDDILGEEAWRGWYEGYDRGDEYPQSKVTLWGEWLETFAKTDDRHHRTSEVLFYYYHA